MRGPRHFLPVLLILLLPRPLSAAPGDADNDGLRDEVETNTGVFVSADNTGTNPNLADSDGDSMPDGMELCLGTNPVNAASKVSRPNIIYIVADDLGYGDVGCFWQNQRTGIMKFSTPGLDAMAAQGAMLTHHYVGASVCVSSRCSFLQGRSQGHADIRDYAFDSPLPNNHNVAWMLKSAGYRTIHIGKAGLTGRDSYNPTAHPLDRGFDRFFGYLTHGQAHEHYPRNGLGKNGAMICNDRSFITDAYQDLFSADAFTAFAKKEIIEQSTLRPDQPFFIYLACDLPHFDGQYAPTANYPTAITSSNPTGLGVSGGIQWTGPPSYVNTAINDPNRVNNPANLHPSCHPSWGVDSKPFVSMVRRMDESVADLLQTLRDLGIDNNTLVVFTSDNGPEPICVFPPNFESYAGFEGIKGDLLEGGIRVPTIAWWPGVIGGTSQVENIRKISRPSANYDWLATFAELAKIQAPAFTDGTSLAPTLTGQGTQSDKGYLYFEMNSFSPTPSFYGIFSNHQNEPRGQMQAVRIGDFMGLRTTVQTANEPFRIYNVVTDPKESVDLAPSRPDLQQRMQVLGLTARRPPPLPGQGRPYDSSPLPALSPIPLRNGVKWKAYEGYWPWLPEFSTLTPVSSGNTSIPTPSVRSRDKDAGLVFEGYLQVPATGAYTFQLAADSNTALWIHECHVIDNDYNYTPTKAGAPIHLSAGLHPFRLYYRHQTGTPSLTLSYSGPGIAMQPVPASSFFVDGQPTVLQADKVVTTRETPITSDVLANDTAENPLILQSVGSPQEGIADIVEGKARYTPAAGYLGFDQFPYTVNDGIAQVSSSVSVTVFFDHEIWLPLDEGAGTSVTAYGAPSPVTGSLSGAADPVQSWIGGKLGKALKFDGVDDRVVFPAMPLPTGGAPRTFSCWLKTSNTSLEENQTIFTYGPSSDSQRFTVRLARGASAESLVAAVVASSGKAVGTKFLNDGRWHHLAIVVADHDHNGITDIAETKLYVDGQADPVSRSDPGLLSTTLGSGSCLGGSDQSADCNFSGNLDDVRIFPRALNGSEVEDLYNDTLATAVMNGMPPNDSDGDGIPDQAEEVAGTNPDDPSSFFRIQSSIINGSGITLQWAGVAGRTYRVEESSNLSIWTLVPGVTPVVVTTNTPNASVNVPPSSAPKRFVRLQVILTP